MNIAIDGPAGAGKSTIAKLCAKKLGAIYVDTGAMYRAAACFMLREGISEKDEEALRHAAERADISIEYRGGEQRVILNGEDVTDELRKEEISSAASAYAASPAVRERLTALQRKLAASTDVVMDGRDIGTVVLPDADLKIFLTADPRVRARRRYDQLMENAGGDASVVPSIEKTEEDIRERDHRDETRKASPLKRAKDAVLIDSSNLGLEEVADRILALAEQRKGTS